MEEEIWKDVVGCEGIYQISNKGRLKRCERDIIHKNGRKTHVRESIKESYEGHLNHGYVEDYFYSDDIVDKHKGDYKRHRLVAEAFLPNPENLPIVRHLDDNPLNNSVDNLAWGTYKDNAQDRKDHKRDTKEFIFENNRVRDLTTGKEYESIQEASNDLGIPKESISDSAYSGGSAINFHIFEWISENRKERSHHYSIVEEDNEVEVWKDIPGLDGLYQISNKGNLKRMARIRPSSTEGKQQSVSEKILKTSDGKTISISLNAKSIYLNINKILNELFTEEERGEEQCQKKSGKTSEDVKESMKSQIRED